MMASRSNPSRRDLLRLLGSAAAASALSPFVPRTARAAPPPRRFVYWYTPVMPAPEFVDPMYQTSPGPLAFGGPFAPLNAVKDKLLFVRGMTNRAAEDAGGRSGGPHPKGGGTYLLGRPFREGLSGDDYYYGAAVGPNSSLDQWLADQIAAQGVQTFLGDLRLGLQNEGKDGNCDRTVSLREGRLRLRHQDAASALRELAPLAGGTRDAAIANQRSVLDFVRGSVARLRAGLGADDRLSLDAHLASIRALEARIATAAGQQCDLALDANGPNLTREDVASDLYVELTRLALTCDATRVVGVQWGPHASTLKYDFLPARRSGASNFHQASHTDGNRAYLESVLELRARQFVNLVTALDSVTETDGSTLLDHTVVLWYTDVPRGHSTDDVFCMLAGAGDYFRLGQMVRAEGAHNLALTSIAHAMGFPISTFGDERYGTGQLPSQALR